MGDNAQRWVVVTDLDGSMLDHHTYSFEAALPALSFLKEEGIPLVLNTSKTRSECKDLAKKLGLLTPIGVENGGGISLPIRADAAEPYGPPSMVDYPEDHSIRLGVSREFIHQVLDEISERRAMCYRSFAQMSIDELRACTGLEQEAAINAQLRQFSEPLLWEDTPEALDWFKKRLHSKGLRLIQGGRFHTVSGLHDKGGAVHWIRSFFASLWHESIHVLALGDGPNDIPMLDAADRAICVRSPAHPPLVGSRGTYSTSQLEGPSGWNESVCDFFFQKLKTNPSSEEVTFGTASDPLEDLTITA